MTIRSIYVITNVLYMLRTLFSFEKYKTNIDEVGGKRRYSENILQWCKNDFKSKNNTNGDYYLFGHTVMFLVYGFLFNRSSGFGLRAQHNIS